MRPGSGQPSRAQASRVPVSRSKARSRAESAERSVEIAVTDHGPGIAPEVRPHLFVPFFTTRAQGTGLGLAISERIVLEMGGRIEVLTAIGSGSTFSVQLPPALGRVPSASLALS